ncbi:hypothetical protein [Stenotrophomonas sp. 17(2023)]|nr:hypothetical protein [Stenotrophomonas sp. 17(2023)]MCA7024936.1 hypothetical protein [Stenotrophomonas acidaminiphila]MCE4074631.1 hypothetical protein [Stenotrophomonas acidaminiphila]OZB64243.1 MAG: hypothetical protein B7X39_17225 [Xanthomonadales bacterium 14-68-21]
MRGLVIGLYVLMIFVFAIYGNWWGDQAYRGFMYNLGGAIFWPIILFPGLGKVIGGLLMLGVLGFIVTRRS